MSPEKPFQSAESNENKNNKPEDGSEISETANFQKKKGISRRSFLKIAGGLAAGAALGGGGYVARELSKKWKEEAEIKKGGTEIEAERTEAYDLFEKKYTKDDLLSGKAPAEDVFKNFGLFAGKIWIKDLAKIYGVKDIKVFFKLAPEFFQHLSKSELEEIVSDLALKYPDDVFENFLLYKPALSDETKFLQTAIDYVIRSGTLVANANLYRHLPESEIIFRQAAQNASENYYYESFLENPEGFNLYPEAQKYLEEMVRQRQAVENYTELFLTHVSKFKEQKWAEELIIRAVQIRPEIAIQKTEEWNFIPHAKDLQDYAFTECLNKLKKGKKYIMTYFAEGLIAAYEYYKDRPEAKMILKMSLDALTENYSLSIIFKEKEKLQNITAKEPWVLDYILGFVKQKLEDHHNTNLSLKAYFLYKDLPEGEAILKRTAEIEFERKNHYQFFEHAEKFLKYKWGEQIISEAMKESPKDTFSYSDKVRNLPVFQNIIKKFLQSKMEFDWPDISFNQSFIFEEDWMLPFLKQLAVKLPNDFLLAISSRCLTAKKFHPLIKEALKNASDHSILNCGNFLLGIDEKSAKEKLAIAAEREPFSVLEKAPYFNRLPNHKNLILDKARGIINYNSIFVLENFKAYRRLPGGIEIARTALREASQEIRDENNKNIRFFEILPKLGFLNKKDLKQSGEQAILNNLFVFGYWFFSNQREKNFYLENFSDKTEIKRVFEICGNEKLRGLTGLESEFRKVILIIGLNNHALEADELFALLSNKENLLNYLVHLKNQPGLKYKNELEEQLEYRCLRTVQNLNNLHNEPPEKRFASVKGFEAEVLYYLMTYGEQEVFTSTFNGLFDRFKARLDSQKKSGFELLEQVKHDKFRNLINLCAQYGRLNEFLETMKSEEQEKMLQNFISELERQKDFEAQAVAVADTFAVLTDEKIMRTLQLKLKQEYDRVRQKDNKKAEILYGLLAGMFGKKALINEAWIYDMAKKYKLPEIIGIKTEKLFNPDGSNVQMHCFYNDKDGKASFKSFINQYTGSKEWRITDYGNFVAILSAGGKRVEIYANKPESDDIGPKEIEKVLADRRIKSIVVVHRGHSYHVRKTIERIPDIAQIVSLGSCGGYSNISAVLERAPEAHIISSKGTGTMKVNDPLLKMLNDEIRGGHSIDWPSFWQRAEEKFGSTSEFLAYVPPHKNLGVLFLKAYYKQIKQEQ